MHFSRTFLILFMSFCFDFLLLSAQNFPQGGQGRASNSGRANNNGRFYGKIVDAKTGKGIEFAAVQLMQNKRDSISRDKKPSLVTGQLTKANGDFSLENVPVFGDFVLKASAVGYKLIEQSVSFEAAPGQGNPQQMPGAFDKDLGNIKMEELAIDLKEVTIDGSAPVLELRPDKKVYNLEKNPVATGGTAEDVLKNVPSVNVDIDGNVSMRNAAPEIFVDGRPTTLTLDQIPADAIQEIEVITNPSAKYDASGGMAGILNIVMKKNRTLGYNGSIRAGVDSRGRINTGGDINIREGKVNWFVSGNLNQRRNKGTDITTRNNLITFPEGSPLTKYTQNTSSENKGYFGMIRSGFDFFVDNRNTFTVAGNFNRGSFVPVDNLRILTDSIYNDGTMSSSLSTRLSENNRRFRNAGATLSYKHLFPGEGKELTADVNYSNIKSDLEGNYFSDYYDATGSYVDHTSRQLKNTDGKNKLLTAQADYSNQVSTKTKIEAGMRANYRNYKSINENFLFDDVSGIFVLQPSQTSNYEFTDLVAAGYFSILHTVDKWSYMAGLRIENSFYDGTLVNTGQVFHNEYPFSVFPSGSVTYKVTEKNDFQLNYTRRINRPSFFQLLPYTDYSDSLNLSRGNPDLKPEFTNSIELSHQYIISRKNSVLTTLYFKNSDGLITRYINHEYDSVLDHSTLISTYVNANSSYAYGAELTVQNNVFSWWDITANINAYQSKINGSNIETGLNTEQFSWFAKMSWNFKLPENFSIQLSGEYQSKTALQQSSGNRGGGMGGGGGGFGGGSQSTAQGYVLPNYSADAAIKYEFLKNNSASITLSIQDIFKTRKNASHSESVYYIQDSERRRDAQVVRLNFSYRFGRFDQSLFKRRNNRSIDTNQDMGM